MTQFAKGTLAMVLACLAWGLSPVYYALFQAISPAEILAHRTLWSVVTFVTLLVLTGRTRQTLHVVRQPRTMGLILLAGVMIAINWYVFIFSVGVGRVTESSLGYYIFPLVMVLLGFVAFRETLSVLQWVSIVLACVAVLVLTIGLGAAPWLALIISFSFGIYGLLKRVIKVDSVVSVTLEVLLLLPFALGYLYWFADLPDPTMLLVLMFSGLITAGPLVLMTYATQRVPMANVGLVQYLNPILQYFCAIVILGEVITGWHIIAIALIWIALVFYWLAVFRAERKTASISSTV
ncbi:MAG: EamA family transporter RarD [Planktomarina sp.]|uniref:EamA family transporter RarD n=1 Tax=Planktomarina sp. TaxID=2024851 RepID=UPI002890C2B3|nr:EamA family transporter RarD [Planktomarina sp.]MDT2031778.1 EamA family transporter RarD [Planktomarina sp.]MDT2071412.1 EamA family transporter RarD [Planktomarina sp.]